MDWFKVDASIWANPKVEDLSDRAYRAMTYVWGYAAARETDGHVPHNIDRLLPRVTPKALAELEERGFLDRNGNGWHIHDWEEHQVDPEEIRARRDARRSQWRESKARRRADRKGGGDDN